MPKFGEVACGLIFKNYVIVFQLHIAHKAKKLHNDADSLLGIYDVIEI